MVALQGLICTNKEEQVYQSEYRDFTDAQTQIVCFEEDIYMPKCNQSSLGYLIPVGMRLLGGNLMSNRLWHPPKKHLKSVQLCRTTTTHTLKL